MASKISRVTVMPPWRSASVTTPTGSEVQPCIAGSGGPRRQAFGRPRLAISDEPPPMSNRIAPSASGSTSGVQPVAASIASVSRSTTSSAIPTSLAHAVEEIAAIFGQPAGLGRDQARAGDAAVAHLVAADAQHLDGAPDRRFPEPSGGGDALAQPDDSGKRIDDAEPVMGGAGHQQAAIVGAEIERSIGRTVEIGSQCRRIRANLAACMFVGRGFAYTAPCPLACEGYLGEPRPPS